MKKVIISESDRSEILKMYGLLNEQYKDGLIPSKGYEIIEDIENNMGTAEKVGGTWKPAPTPHKGDELEGVIKKYIKDFPNGLTEKEWFKIDPLFRIQIYSFMFQAGSSVGKEYRWIAGLAQAIDPSLDRGKIISDVDYRNNAYNLVKQKIKDGTINDYYDKYISKIVEQYKSLTPPTKPGEQPTDDKVKEYKQKFEISWKNRPKIIEEMWNGADISQIMEKYFPTDSENKTNTIDTKPNSSAESENFLVHVDLKKDAFNELSKKLQKWSEENIFEGELYSIDSVELKYNPNGNQILFRMVVGLGNLKIKKVVLAINDESKRAQESKGYKLIKSGKIQLPGEFASSKPGGYDWYLFAELIK